MSEKSIKVLLKDVRLSFPNLFRPQPFTDKTTGRTTHSYNAAFLVPKVLADGAPNPQIVQIANVIKRVQAGKWGDNVPRIAADRRCFRDGEPVDTDSGEPKPLYDGYAGHYVLSAKNPIKEGEEDRSLIQVVGPRKTAKDSRGNPIFPVLTSRDGLIYPGCYVNAFVTIYAFDGSKLSVPHRVNASIEAVQFIRHGEKFGANVEDANDVFEEAEGEDDITQPASGGAAATDDELFN